MSSFYVYVLGEDDFTHFVKVGMSKNPDRRCRDLNTSYPGHKPLRVLYKLPCNSAATALAVEHATRARIRLAGIKVRKEKAWCPPSTAYGHAVLAWESANHVRHEDLQQDLFDDAA